MTEIINTPAGSLAEVIKQIILDNTGLAIGLMGVGTGWEDSGAKRFEVRISMEVSQDVVDLFPTNHAGFSVHYERVGEIALQ